MSLTTQHLVSMLPLVRRNGSREAGPRGAALSSRRCDRMADAQLARHAWPNSPERNNMPLSVSTRSMGTPRRAKLQLAAQLHDDQRHMGLDGAGRLLGTRGLVQQACSAIGQVSAQPLAGGDRADTVRGTSIRCAGATFSDVLN